MNVVADRLRSCPRIDILVNNAGASLKGGLLNSDPAGLENLLRLNSFVPALLAQAVLGRDGRAGYGRNHQHRLGYGSLSGISAWHLRRDEIVRNDFDSEHAR